MQSFQVSVSLEKLKDVGWEDDSVGKRAVSAA